MDSALQETIIRADELYLGRHQIENVRNSVALLQKVTLQIPDYEVFWRLARSYFFLGQQAEDANQASRCYADGIDAAARATALQGNKVEGHFWLGVNLALAAENKRALAPVRSAIAARRELKRAVEIDPGYHGAGPLRVLARLEQKLPRWLGGGKALAEQHYREALALAPDNTVTRIYFAELLLESAQKDAAREQLESIINIETNAEWAFEIERDREQARDLMQWLAGVR